MWADRRLLDLLGIAHPIVQAPMAGAGTAEMAIGAGEAGALGSLACAMLTPEGIRNEVGFMYGDDPRPQDVGHFHLAIDPERTVGRAQFATRLQQLLTEIAALAVAEDSEEILIPGEPEARTRAARERRGGRRVARDRDRSAATRI